MRSNSPCHLTAYEAAPPLFRRQFSSAARQFPLFHQFKKSFYYDGTSSLAKTLMNRLRCFCFPLKMYTRNNKSFSYRQSSSVAVYLTGHFAAALLEKKNPANSGYFPRYMTNDEGLIFEGKCIFEIKPPPQPRSCLLLKKGGLIFGRIRYMYLTFFN